MCAQFLLKLMAKDLETLISITLGDDFPQWSERILPYNQSPVITAKGLRLMNFSLIPSWSKERKVKFATHNARIETLAEKPTWKAPLESKRCLVPLNGFIEPIYQNEFAGHMVTFKTPDDSVLFAAGLYDEWVDKTTGEVIESFAIITTEPIGFVKNVGHDRSPVFLPKNSMHEWIAPEKKSADRLIEFLKIKQVVPDLIAKKDRPMRPGWEKRK